MNATVEGRIAAERLDSRDTATIERAQLVVELERHSATEGLDVRISSVLDGYLETSWYSAGQPKQEVLLRFWIDPVGPLGYQLTAEAVYRRIADPSLPSRQREVMVPPGHDGEAMLIRFLNAVRDRFRE